MKCSVSRKSIQFTFTSIYFYAILCLPPLHHPPLPLINLPPLSLLTMHHPPLSLLPMHRLFVHLLQGLKHLYFSQTKDYEQWIPKEDNNMLY